jgi:hypothetical protein
MAAAVGLALVGVASLRRSYRTTLRLYTGHFKSRKPQVTAASLPREKKTVAVEAGGRFLERQLPWVSEHATAVALACFRSLTRAPEAKTMLLTPVILVVIFGSMFLRNNSAPSEFVRPIMGAAAITMILFGLIGVAGNQFGFDRSGFRVFILASASRKDILLGKNLSLLPFVAVLGTIAMVVLEIAVPMRIDHFFAVLLQMPSMFLVFCIVCNFLSILAPMAIAPGSLKPAKPKGIMILIHMGFFFVFPIALATTLVPLGVEFLLSWSGTIARAPIYLALSTLELVAMRYVYPVFLDVQGRMLQNRELRILEIVTAKVE